MRNHIHNRGLHSVLLLLCLHCLGQMVAMERICFAYAYGFGFTNIRPTRRLPSSLSPLPSLPSSTTIHAPTSFIRPSLTVMRMSSANEDGVTNNESAADKSPLNTVSPVETTTTSTVTSTTIKTQQTLPKPSKLSALEQAEKLRQRAQQLKEEANAAEIALRSIQAKKKQIESGNTSFLPFPVAANTSTKENDDSIDSSNTNANTNSNANTNGNSGGEDVSHKNEMENYINETFGFSSSSSSSNLSEFNMTKVMGEIIQVPLWVPSSILPFIVIHPTVLQKEDLKLLRSDVLKHSQFRVVSSDAMKFAAVYRGTFVEERQASSLAALSSGVPLSGADIKNDETEHNGGDGSSTTTSTSTSTRIEQLSEVVFRDIQEKLERSGLSERIQLFLMEDPEWRPGDREEEPLPAILAVSTNVLPEQTSESGLAKKAITGLSIASTIFATFAYAVSGYALNPQFFSAIVDNSDASAIGQCLPIFFGVWALSLVHEIAHYVAAKATDVKIGLPVPIPSLQIGTFGSITPLRSFPKSRTALFDVAMSGPLVTAMTSIGCMVAGIFMTIQTSAAADISTLATVPVALLKTSFLVGSLTSVFAPKVMTLPLSQPIPIHPLFLIGFAGLIVSALNLLPIGRLDGGRACSAMLGRRSAYLVSFTTLLFLAIAALTQTSAVSIFFGLIVTVFQRNADVPVKDELSGVDDVRMGVYIFSIVLTVLTLAPFPGGLPI